MFYPSGVLQCYQLSRWFYKICVVDWSYCSWFLLYKLCMLHRSKTSSVMIRKKKLKVILVNMLQHLWNRLSYARIPTYVNIVVLFHCINQREAAQCVLFMVSLRSIYFQAIAPCLQRSNMSQCFPRHALHLGSSAFSLRKIINSSCYSVLGCIDLSNCCSGVNISASVCIGKGNNSACLDEDLSLRLVLISQVAGEPCQLIK